MFKLISACACKGSHRHFGRVATNWVLCLTWPSTWPTSGTIGCQERGRKLELPEAIVVHPSILIPGRKEDKQSSANEAGAINGICSSRQSRLEAPAVHVQSWRHTPIFNKLVSHFIRPMTVIPEAPFARFHLCGPDLFPSISGRSASDKSSSPPGG